MSLSDLRLCRLVYAGPIQALGFKHPAAPIQAIRRFSQYLGRDAVLGDLRVTLICGYGLDGERFAAHDAVETDVSCLFALARALGAVGYVLPREDVQTCDEQPDPCEDCDCWRRTGGPGAGDR